MFPIFSKTKNIVSRKVSIETIHEEFDSASLSLLEEAKKILQMEESKDEVVYTDLIKLGFSNSKTVLNVKKTNEKKDYLATQEKLILYYQQKYPEYKFISVSEVDKICAKYNLVQVMPERFIGHIPLSNAKDILNIKNKIDVDDKMFIHFSKGPMDVNDYASYYRVSKDYARSAMFDTYSLLVVCTPDLISWDETLDSFGRIMVKDPDPVVLTYVKGGYLIVTKWGTESDMEEFK